jgi:hypothetical protein
LEYNPIGARLFIGTWRLKRVGLGSRLLSAFKSNGNPEFSWDLEIAITMRRGRASWAAVKEYWAGLKQARGKLARWKNGVGRTEPAR